MFKLTQKILILFILFQFIPTNNIIFFPFFMFWGSIVPHSAKVETSALPKHTPASIYGFAKLPFCFWENRNPGDEQAKYVLQRSEGTVVFGPEEVLYQFANIRKNDPISRQEKRPLRENLRLRFIGANHELKLCGLEESEAKFSIFRGSDPSKWISGAPSYLKVAYQDLYPGIDLIVSGESRRLKNTYLVKSGADAGQIRWNYEGAREIHLNNKGQLVVKMAYGVLSEDRPLSYQWINGKRIDVPSEFKKLATNSYAISIGEYDKRHELVIDPGLEYSTYLGGNGEEEGMRIAVDSQGNTYITGYTYSTNFPLTNGAFDNTINGTDVFVVKLNSAGNGLVFSTVLGGTNAEEGHGIAVDGSGNIYLTGWTNSTDFPVTPGAFDPSYNPGSEWWHHDAFVTKLNSSGTALLYSSYLGGSYNDSAYAGIVVDSNRNAYVAGYTSSGDFPTTPGAFRRSLSGHGDAFITKLNPTGTALVFSTYLGGKVGGNGDDGAGGIAIDSSGYVYITGDAGTTDFPTTPGAYDRMYNGGARDVFITKLNASGTGLIYSTYLGSSGYDSAWGLAIDRSGSAYVAGETDQAGFPITAGAFDTSYNGGTRDGFIAKINPSGSSLLYSTFLGGKDNDCCLAIVVDNIGNAYVTGNTFSDNFPSTPGAYDTSWNGYSDIFISKLNPQGTALLYSTYLGGPGGSSDGFFGDIGRAIAINRTPFFYVTGKAYQDFPTTSGAYDQSYNDGSSDAFVAKFSSSLTKNDFNGDGQEDILWRYYGSGGKNVVWYMKGATRIGSASLPAIMDLNWQIVGTGDFNGDGWLDILWRYYGSGGKNVVWYMKGATRTGTASLPAITDLNWQIVGTGDFNGDGWPDILWRYSGSGGANVVWYMKGASRTGTASLPVVADLNWKIGGTGDFNGDGWPDVLWRYNGSGGKNVVWYMKGASRTGSASLAAVIDLSWKIGGTGDINGDGWPDILWRYYGSGGKDLVWYMQGATRTGTASLPAITDLNWRIENH
jgi:hypothetical protein